MMRYISKRLTDGSLFSMKVLFFRDPRGFAVKHYTEDGIWDIVGFHAPMFFARDPILFTLIAHSQKKNPVTNVRVSISIEVDTYIILYYRI